jgi:CopG family nickel-responsive transcriptional regulator
MGNLYRFGVSLERDLIDAFDQYIQERNYGNRSEAIRDLIRNELIRKTHDEGGLVAGAIVMTYDHNKNNLLQKMLLIQHDYHDSIISTQHVHLDHDYCLEIIAVRGRAEEVDLLASRLKSLVGVKHLDVSISAPGSDADHDLLK